MENFLWEILFYALLLDSSSVLLITFTNLKSRYLKYLPKLAYYFPASKGWAIYYFTLALLIGYIIHSYVTPIYLFSLF